MGGALHRRLRVGLTYNLRRGSGDADAEFDSPATIDAIRDALARDQDVVPIEADDRAPERLRRERPDIVFNFAECAGGPAREAYIPAVLEMLRIPYTGSDPLTLALCLHKPLSQTVLAAHGVPVAPFIECAAPPEDDPPFGYPAIVKPAHEGSGKGIRNDSVVGSLDELRDRVGRIVETYRQPAIVERFLPGREFTAALLGNGPELRVLPLVGMNFDALPEGARPVYGYEAKWVYDTPDRPLDIFECPARVDEETAWAVCGTARRAFEVMRCRDWCRIDLRLDAAGVPHVLELNPIPGILPRPEENSCFPKAARAAGIEFDDLVRGVLAIASRRAGLALPEPAPV